MGHDKSWVNRRLALAEALSDELQADLRLGLVDATTGRELARLPRDNQREIATVVQRRGLTTRQTRTLADAWLAAPSSEVREALLSSVRGTRQDDDDPAPRRPRTAAEWLQCEAEELRRRCGRLHGRLVGGPLPSGGDDADALIGLRALVPALSLAGPHLVPPQEPAARSPLTVSAFGMQLHAATTVDGRDRKQLERLCRYMLRPPFARSARAKPRERPQTAAGAAPAARWRDNPGSGVAPPARLCDGRVVRSRRCPSSATVLSAGEASSILPPRQCSVVTSGLCGARTARRSTASARWSRRGAGGRIRLVPRSRRLP